MISMFTGFAQKGQSTKWENPFEKGKQGIDYEVSSKKLENGNTHFKVKGNSIEVLYDWKGTKAPFATITTKKEYSYYNLELEYKWGDRKFEPRLEAKRDAGILFHIHNENVVWPSSVECQIQEEDTGDLWVIKGPKVMVVNADGTEKEIDTKVERFQSNRRYAMHEVEGWNHVRVEVRGAEGAKFYVNGHLVNEVKAMYNENGEKLEKGLIGLQAEGAELTYRKVRIQEVLH